MKNKLLYWLCCLVFLFAALGAFYCWNHAARLLFGEPFFTDNALFHSYLRWWLGGLALAALSWMAHQLGELF